MSEVAINQSISENRCIFWRLDTTATFSLLEKYLGQIGGVFFFDRSEVKLAAGGAAAAAAVTAAAAAAASAAAAATAAVAAAASC